MQALWVPSPPAGEGQDEGKRGLNFHFSLNTLTLSRQGRGKDKGGTLPRPKFEPDYCREQQKEQTAARCGRTVIC